MAVADVHPSAEELAAFTLGTLGEETQVSIESHVAACTSCQERAAVAPSDTLVELLRRVHARTGRGTDTFVDAAVQVQTPVLLSAVAGTDSFVPTLPSSAPAESGCAEISDVLPPELADHERYSVVRLVGVGGMGAVYEAEHRVMQRPVALKVIKRTYTASAAALERFRREVRAAARLSHPNIVITYDAEDAGETHFLVMEYVEGTDLGRLVQERGPLPVDRACDYIRQAALGLEHAFDQGMVHRDLKPHNLMLTPDGRVKILDFGLARFASEAADVAGLTSTGMVLGTVDYIAPEQADNAHQADIRSDIYSLGCTLYHLLAGKPPFPTGTPIQKVMAHREKKPQPLTELRDDLPEGLMPVVERMMAKDPKHRYQTPAEVALALEPFLRATAVRTTDPGRTVVLDRIPVGERRRPRLALATAILAFFVSGLLGVAVYRIVTDNGELLITTERDDVKVVITQGGKLVDIIDTKSDKQIRLTLRSGEYELELKGAPEGLNLNIKKATLTRGATVLATITRETSNPAAPKYLMLPIDEVATAVSTKSLFTGANVERLIFPTWGRQEVFDIPFDVIDPKGDSVKNAIVLYGPLSLMAREMPQAVKLKCGSAAKAIHLLSGVAGWGWGGSPDQPINKKRTVCVIVRLHYRDGGEEDHELINGVHFCDYTNVASRGTEVPGSRLAIQLIPEGDIPRQIRYLTIQPKNPTKVIEDIEFIKGMKGDVTAPVIMAVTVERPASSAEKSAEKLGEVRRFLGHSGPAYCVACSRDGRYAVSGSGWPSEDYTIRLWDITTGKQIRQFLAHYGQLFSVDFSPDGRRILYGAADNTAVLLNVATGKEVWRFTGDVRQKAVYGVRFSPNGRHVLLACEVGTVIVCDPDENKIICKFEGHGDRGMSAVFTPDGKRALSGAINDTIYLWDAKTGEKVRSFEGHKGGVHAIDISPDGHYVLAGSNEGKMLRLWDVATGKLLREFIGHEGSINGVAFSGDGCRAISCSSDKTVRLWDVATGKEIYCFTGHTDTVWRVAFSPDDRYALSASHDKTLRMWRLPDPPSTRKRETDSGLIKNGGFEAGMDGWKGWSHWTNQSQFEFDRDVVREGRQSLRLTASEPADCGVYQVVDLKPRQWYRFTGWVRTRGLKVHGTTLRVGTITIHRWPIVPGEPAWQVLASGDNHWGDTEWTPSSLRFQAPDHGGQAYIGVRLAGFGRARGTAWFDGLKLVETSPPPANENP